ncbi:hypothetical protein Baya_13981 [Bagarius yarrelli]|uniref:Uncharacterized protein n=1 Tax=Bagarius yarrelli TaxID=175774 RepID=A0A556V760_BAGYA|nr:hypothetical protein Baya_13981 [Bagarius yarrelli]
MKNIIPPLLREEESSALFLILHPRTSDSLSRLESSRTSQGGMTTPPTHSNSYNIPRLDSTSLCHDTVELQTSPQKHRTAAALIPQLHPEAELIRTSAQNTRSPVGSCDQSELLLT